MEKPDYRVYKNVLRMLRDRKWQNVPPTLSAKEYDDSFTEIPLIYSESNILHVFFIEVPIMKKSHLVSCLRTMKNEESTHALIIYKNSITSATSKYIIDNDTMDCVQYQTLLRCCLDHMFVPDYELLLDEDKKKLPYKNENLPMMLTSDPIARWYDAKKGDIFRIMRKNPQSGYDVFYRVVV